MTGFDNDFYANSEVYGPGWRKQHPGWWLNPTTGHWSPPEYGPGWIDISVTPRETLNRSSKSIAEIQLPVCAANAPLRYGWGRNRIGAMLLRPVTLGMDLLFPYIIGRGPISAIASLELDNAALPAGVQSHTYLGLGSQVVDPWLEEAWRYKGGYGDTLPWIAWGVLRIPPTVTNISGLTIEADFMLVYDPRADSTNGGSGSQRLANSATWTYSNNAALVLANYLNNSTYGKGETLDWATVATVADINDQVLGGLKRRTVNLVIDSATALDDVEDTLRTYAGCFIVREEVTRLIPDAPASPVYAFTDTAGSANYVLDSLKLVQRAQKNTPTLVTVVWTDTSVKPWIERHWTEPQELPIGSAWREQVINLPGIHDAGMAQREALRRLNEYTTSDLSATLVSTDPSIQLRKGDVVTLTDKGGLTAKAFRLIGHAPQDLGRWMESLSEYDPLIYSDSVASNPTYPDTSFPSPSAPPAVTGLSDSTWLEEIYRTNTGELRSRLKATWDDVAVNYPFFVGYQVEMYVGGTQVQTPTVTRTPTFAFGPVQENIAYTIKVYTVSSMTISTPATATRTALGKLERPGNVPYFFVYDAAGEVRFLWNPALDLDVAAHEIRYGPRLTATWGTAALVDRIAMPARTYLTRALPPGDYIFFIKALDSILTTIEPYPMPYGQESTDAATAFCNLGGDPDLFIADIFDILSPTTSNMVVREIGGVKSWVTDYGGKWNTIFADHNLNWYTNPLATYSGAGTSWILSESCDFGQEYSGTIISTLAYTDLIGTAQPYIGTSLDGSSWIWHVGLSALASFRFVCVKVETTGVMLITSLGQIQASIVALTETGEVTTSDAVWVTVTLERRYAKVKTIQLTAEATGGQANPGYSNVVLASDPRVTELGVIDETIVDQVSLLPCTFDVKCWDGLNTLVAKQVKYLFQGI